MRNVCLRFLGLASLLVALMGVANEAAGQTVQFLMQFTNTWQYDQSGRNLTGTKWNTNDYVLDAPWQPASRGLLAAEDVTAPYEVHAPINTPLTISSTVTTYYFRTTFQFTGATNGITLIATNLVDDGCVIYLNGREAGRVRVATANHNATTLATGPTTEGQLDVVSISPGLLRSGPNLMAVEVHQSGNTSTDIMFGMKLLAFVPTALTITNQPVGDTIAVGDSYTLSVGVSGGPVFYQWTRNGAAITGATNSTYAIQNAQLISGGTFQVRVTNAVSSLLSSPAVVNVVEDTTGPKIVSAVIREQGTRTNLILITFNETMIQGGQTTNVNNYRVNVCGSPNTVTVTQAAWGGAQVQLQVSGPNWNLAGCYYLTVNNVADIRGNNINPNSIIGVALPITTNLTQMSDVWTYNANAALEDLFNNNSWSSNFNSMAWTKTNFVANPDYWSPGQGILYFDPNATVQLCSGDGFGQLMSYQNAPVLFRRTFRWDPAYGSVGTFRLRYIIDDGMILYVNGREVHRFNMPAGAYTENTLASTTVTAPTCTTNVSITVSNLFPGTNWIAAAVFQGPTSESDTVFGLEMDGSYDKTGTTPPNSNNTNLLIAKNQRVLSWPSTNYGWALMFSTNMNIIGNGSNAYWQWRKSPTNWTQVKDQSNPYTITNPPPGPRRFYQLVPPGVPLNE